MMIKARLQLPAAVARLEIARGRTAQPGIAPRSTLHAPRSTPRGGSLVEVLVVLVILVLGIFGVARLFPSGFGSIRYTERVSVARSLARTTEEFFRARAANLPDGILALNPLTGLINPNLDPMTLFIDQDYLGPGPTSPAVPDPRWSGQNRWRHVIGEVVRIPPPTTGSTYVAQGSSVSIYNLLFSPIYSVSAIPPDGKGNGSTVLVVYSATPQKRVTISSLP